MANQKVKRKYYTSGEFARVCRTTKETLRHYEAVAFCPRRMWAKIGYRYYTTGQFFDYDLIVTLKEAGCTLSEIKEYLVHYEAEDFSGYA